MKKSRRILAAVLAVSILASMPLPVGASSAGSVENHAVVTTDEPAADPVPSRTEEVLLPAPLPEGDPSAADDRPIPMGALGITAAGASVDSTPESDDATGAASSELQNSAEVTTDTEITWAVDEAGVLTISGSMADYSRGGAPWYSEHATAITAVTFAGEVTHIGAYAFYGLTALTSVTLPQSLLSLGRNAFSGCTALTELALPDSITSIGFECFYGCSALSRINIPTGWTECPSYSSESSVNYAGQIFENCTSLTSVTVPEGITALPSYAFNGANYLEQIQLPSTLTEIRNHTFYGCTSLTSVIVPEGVTALGKSAFCDCSSLTDVTLPESLTTLSLYAFNECTSLESIHLPDSITSIGYRCFYGCSKLSRINIPTGWTECPSWDTSGTRDTDHCGQIFMNCTNLKSITVSEGMTALPIFAFNGSNYLEQIQLPDSLTDLGSLTFYGCTKLQSISIPEGVTSLRKSLFSGCSKLSSVEILGPVTVLELYAFYNCSSLKSIALPDTITSIGFKCFYGCSSLTTVNIPLSWNSCPSGSTNGTVNTSYCGQIFSGCSSLKSITVPEGMTELPGFAFNGSNSLEQIQLPSSLKAIKNHTFYNCTSLKSITIPDGVTSLGKSAFCYCSKLTDVTLPESMTTLELYAFNGCSALESIRLPDSITALGYKCFAECSALAQINLPLSWNSCPSSSSSVSASDCGYIFADCSKLLTIAVPDGITSLPNYAFNGCNRLKNILLPSSLKTIGTYAFRGCGALTSIAIPAQVTAIPAYAFYNCSTLEVVNLPDTVTEIAKYAFYGCPTSLTINYTGNSDQWDDISVTSSGNSNFSQYEVVPDYEVSLTAQDIIAVWEGEYGGSHGDIDVRRHFVMVTEVCTDTGFISGTLTFSISEEETSGSAVEYAANGSYIFEGTFNPQTGILFFQGQIWLDHPDEYDNFTFVTFDGSLSGDKQRISGINENDSSRMFYGDLVSKVVQGNTQVTMTTESSVHNLLSESVTVTKGSKEHATITVTPDWNGAEPGSIKLLQKNTTVTSGSGVFIDIQPGELFTADESIYAVLEDASGKVMDTIYLQLHVINPDTSRNEQPTNSQTFRLLLNRKHNDSTLSSYVAAEEDLGHAIYKSQTCWADSNGTISLPEQPAESVTFSQVGYQDRTLTPQQLKNTPSVYLQKWKEGIPLISGVWVDDLDIMNYETRIVWDDTSSYTFTVEMDWNLQGAGTVQLWQDGVTADFDSNGKLTLAVTEKFDVLSPIYILATAESGAVCKRQLKITGSAAPKAIEWLSGAGVSFGDSISLTLPDSIPLFGGGKISAGISSMIPVTVSAKDGVVMVAVGADIAKYSYSDTATTIGNGSTYHKLDRNTKTFIDDLKGKVFDADDLKKATKGLKDINKKYKSAIALRRGSFAFDADFTVLGFMEGTYDSAGNIRWLDTGLILNPSVSAEWGTQTSIGPVPVYLEAILKAELTAKLNLLMNKQAKQVRPFGNVTGEISVRIGGGVGLRKVVGIGGGGKGALTPYWTIRQNAKDYFRLTASLNLYAKAFLGPLSYTKDFKTLAEDVWLEYPNSTSSLAPMSAALSSSSGPMDIYNLSNYKLADLSYLDKASVFTANSADATSSDTRSSETVLKTNIYQQSATQFLSFEDGTALAVWLDAPENDINRITLWYSFFDGADWSAPGQVYSDGTLDNSPELKLVGQRVFLAWQNSSSELTAATTPDALAACLDISVAEFIPGEGFQVTTFSQSGLDMMPVLCGSGDTVCAVWVNNSENSWFGDNQSNHIYCAQLSGETWSTPAQVYSNLNSIDSIDAHWDDSLTIAYSMDTDGDIATIVDLCLYVNGSRHTAGTAAETNPIYADNQLFWYSQGNILSDSLAGTGALPTDRYQILSHNSTLLALYTESTGTGNMLMASYLDRVEGSWSDAIALTDDSCCIVDFSGFASEDGALQLLLNRQPVLLTPNDGSVCGDSELVLMTITQTCDLAIAEVSYDDTAFSAGAPMNLSVEISNPGSSAVNAYTITCTDSAGNTLTTLSRANTLMPGETIEDYFSVVIPADATREDITIRIAADGRSDLNGDDNTVTLSLSYENLRLEYLDWSFLSTGGAVIYADVVNRGYSTCSDLTVNLYRDSTDTDPVASETIDSLDAMDLTTLCFTVPYAEGAVYHVEIVPVEQESLTVDNSGYLVLLRDEEVHTHEYTAVTVAPTCTERGCTEYTCSCGDSYQDSFVDATGHHYTDGSCTVCGHVQAAKIASGWSGYCSWILTDDGVLTFSGEGDMRNYTYKSEMPWYPYLAQIDSVVIESGVTSIGSYAFYGMDIESVSIPETVTRIGDYAFKNASRLNHVVLPSNLTRLGESAFYACTALTAIDIPASLWTVQPYTFKNCTALETVTFHEGNLQKISDGAFYATAVRELILPDCLDILDVYSFKNCTALASVKLSSSLTQIREAALYGTAISEITIPEGVTVIKPYAFKNCVKLERVVLPESLTGVEEAAFYACTSLKSVELPDSVTEIGNYAFRRCTGLTSVGFGAGLTQIGESSFYGCTGLTELVVPDKVTVICAYAFKGCTGLTIVGLPGSLTTIGDSAFHSCTGLETIIIPANVTAIGEYCFSGSRNLWKITFKGNAPAIGTGAFKGLSATAYYPGGNATWTAAVMQNYGGTITWKAN